VGLLGARPGVLSLERMAFKAAELAAWPSGLLSDNVVTRARDAPCVRCLLSMDTCFPLQAETSYRLLREPRTQGVACGKHSAVQSMQTAMGSARQKSVRPPRTRLHTQQHESVADYHRFGAAAAVG